ncbi:hypothetical protein [Sulfurimonas sp.]|nr:hypothetical protein [Sulfurimonas sp.]
MDYKIMKAVNKFWDMFLHIFAFSTTKYCDKLKWNEHDNFMRGNH